jgi:hypothetical protein
MIFAFLYNIVNPNNSNSQDCDLGDQSILHAVRMHPRVNFIGQSSGNSLQPPSAIEGSKPMCETLIDLQLTLREREQLGLVDQGTYI